MRPARFGSLLFGTTITFVCLTGILVGRVQAQEPPPGLVWEARYNRPQSNEQAVKVVTDNEGNTYVTGIGLGPTGSYDFVTVKYDPSGKELWKDHYGNYSLGPDCYPNFVHHWETPADIGIDETGNVYVTGSAHYEFWCPVNHVYYYGEMITVKYESHGNRLWAVSQTFSWVTPSVSAMAVDPAGNAHVAATVDDVARITKYSPYGQELWTIHPVGQDADPVLPADIAVDTQGNVYITGRSWGDYTTVKYDSEGNEVWVARYDGWEDNLDRAEAIFVNSQGEVFVTGSSEGPGTGLDYATVKYDPDGNQLWVARYGAFADSSDEAVSVAADDLGHVFVTGTAGGFWPGNDIVTIGYDSRGNQVWEERYDGPAGGSDSAVSLALTALGDVVVTGRSEGADSAWDFVTVCYESSSGTERWTARYNGPANEHDRAVSASTDNLGNVIVLGSSQGIETWTDFATIKYDPMGTETWVARFENPGMGGTEEEPRAMALDSAGNVCVTGKSSSPAGTDCATVKYDPEGNEIWSTLYNGPSGGGDEARDLAVDVEGNIHITGFSDGEERQYDYLTVKYDPEGNELWVARYDGPANATDQAFALMLDPSGNVYVTGQSEGSARNDDFATVRYDSDGNELWVARYDGPANARDVPYGMALDPSGNVCVTGRSEGTATDEDFATIKYDPDGNQLWIARYDGPANTGDVPYGIAVDVSGNTYVTGYSTGSTTGRDYATIKYDPDGDELWVARYNGPTSTSDVASSLALDGLGNTYVTGGSYDANTGDYVSVTIKYDPDGNELWVENGGHWISVAIALDASGSVYIGGSPTVYDHYGYLTYQTYEIAELDSLGNRVGGFYYDGPFIGSPLFGEDGHDNLVAIATGDPGEVYVTGWSEFQGSGSDFATIKYTTDLACTDRDGDGYGTPGSPECPYPERDCDDTDPGVNPGNMEDDWEACHNGIDDDCDGFPDFDPYGGWYGCLCNDYDGDGYGSQEDLGRDYSDTLLMAGCAYPEEDCDPVDFEVYPNAPELCDYKDNQCPGDPGYGEVDEGCALTLVSPENGASLRESPTFTWEAGLSDQFYLYLGMPVLGYGYLTFVIPTVEHGFAFPTDTWQESITMRYWWSAWMVVGVDTSVEPPAWEASEVRWFKKIIN